jgi:hypothetical protein
VPSSERSRRGSRREAPRVILLPDMERSWLMMRGEDGVEPQGCGTTGMRQR